MRISLNVVLKLLGLLFMLSAMSVFGAQAESPVQRYFRDLNSLRADFVQQVFDEDFRLLQTSSGRMYMQKPGRFRWDYQKPYQQIIVADGSRLWLYDSELEQVTVKRLDTALSSTPLALLSGAAPIQQAFTIRRIASGEDQLQWYELRPKEKQTEFKLLRVAFDKGQLRAIELEDMFNQRTRLDFQHLERNVSIDPALLRFVPPADVDVIGDVP